MDSLSNLVVSALAQIGRVISTVELPQSNDLALAPILGECRESHDALLEIQNSILKCKNSNGGVTYSEAVTEKHAAVLRACSSTFISINDQLAKLQTSETKSKRSSVLSNTLRSLLKPSKNAQIEAMCDGLRDQKVAIDHLLHKLQE